MRGDGLLVVWSLTPTIILKLYPDTRQMGIYPGKEAK